MPGAGIGFAACDGAACGAESQFPPLVLLFLSLIRVLPLLPSSLDLFFTLLLVLDALVDHFAELRVDRGLDVA